MTASRRAFLAGLGSLALAGCTQDGESGTGTDTGTRTESPTATRTPTPSPSEPPAEITTDWAHFAADPGRTNATDAPGPVERPAELWDLTADAGLSQPVVADGTCYVGSEAGTLHAADARTGDRQWTASVGGPLRWLAVADETIYGAAGDAVVAVDSDGQEQWREPVADLAALSVADGVFALRGGDSPAVRAFDRDGTDRWTAEMGDPWEPTLFVGDAVSVSSGTSDNEPWAFDPATGEFVGDHRPRAGGHHFRDERCYRDGVVYATDPFYGNVYAGYEWSRQLPPSRDLLFAPGPDRLYVTAPGGEEPGVYGLDGDSGEVTWKRNLAGIAGRPVAAGEVVVVPADDGLHGVAPGTGERLWHLQDVSGTEVAVVDDLVLVASGGTLQAFR